MCLVTQTQNIIDQFYCNSIITVQFYFTTKMGNNDSPMGYNGQMALNSSIFSEMGFPALLLV